MGMYKRVLVAINSGPMSTTAAAVRPWEIPILREVHGAGAVSLVNEPEALEDAKYKGMLDPENFEITVENLQIEYDRLCMYYGMHKEIKASNCERVFGLFDDGKFERAVRKACSGVAPIAEDNVETCEVSVPPLPSKSIEELRDDCEALGIEWAPGMSARVLQAMIDDVLDPGAAVEPIDRVAA